MPLIKPPPHKRLPTTHLSLLMGLWLLRERVTGADLSYLTACTWEKVADLGPRHELVSMFVDKAEDRIQRLHRVLVGVTCPECSMILEYLQEQRGNELAARELGMAEP